MAILKHVDFEVPGLGELATAPTEVPSYRDAVMALNPLAYWRFGEAAGPTLTDQTGQHNLQFTGSVSLSQSGAIQHDHDSAVLFSGGSAQTSQSILPSTANAPFSIAFWVRLPAGPVQNGAFAGQYTGTTDGEARLHITPTGILRFSTLNQLDLFTAQMISTEWRSVVLTRSATGEVSWYIDGQLDTSLSGAGRAIPQASFAVGTITSTIPSLYLDEFAIFDTALSPDQARWLDGLGRATLHLSSGT